MNENETTNGWLRCVSPRKRPRAKKQPANQTKHTPGAARTRVEDTLTYQILEAYDGRPFGKKELERTNLCNAAPDLLAALKAMALVGIWGKSSPILAQAIAAIAKAEGNSRLEGEAHQRELEDEAAGEAEESGYADPYQAGAIVESQWGYDQTNADFYRIVARKGDWLSLVPLHTVETNTGNMTGQATPGEPMKAGDYVSCHGTWNGKPIRRRLPRNKENGKLIGGFSFGHGWASIWDGTPVSVSHYA